MDSLWVRKLLESDFSEKFIFPLIGDSSILHLCNGQYVESSSGHNQALWHRDFNKIHRSTPALAINALFFLPDGVDENKKSYQFGVIPYSHKSSFQPVFPLFENSFISLEPGDCLLFDSQLWHRICISNHDQIFLNVMYTTPFIKQQIYLLGTDESWLENNGYSVDSDFARLLGWWSRPPASVHEFRHPVRGVRTYRSGEG